MNIESLFPGKYVKASDIPAPVTLQMNHVQIEEVGKDRHGDPEKKPVLYFIKAERGLVLNKTNATVIGNAYGTETDTWKGKAITLFATTTEAFGEIKACIRVRLTQDDEPAPQAFSDSGMPSNPAPPVVQPEHHPDIPF
jgi:hypothetical protein